MELKLEQLPNIGIKYQIINFEKETGIITVHFIGLYHELNIILTIEDDKYISGLALDNYIMGFRPAVEQSKTKKFEVLPENTEYISNLVVSLYNTTNEFVDKRQKLLARRYTALNDSDWTQLPDVQDTLSQEDKVSWKKFRQELRDITKQKGFPFNVDWPQRPHIMGTIVYE